MPCDFCLCLPCVCDVGDAPAEAPAPAPRRESARERAFPAMLRALERSHRNVCATLNPACDLAVTLRAVIAEAAAAIVLDGEAAGE